LAALPLVGFCRQPNTANMALSFHRLFAVFAVPAVVIDFIQTYFSGGS
jgi:hypothetical protein